MDNIKHARYEYPEEARKKYLGTSKKHTTEEFIEICQAIYGKDKYDYSLVEYDGNKKKVKIICNNCGTVFEQKAIHHMHGHGCPVCSKGGKKKVIAGINDLQTTNPEIAKYFNEEKNGVKATEVYAGTNKKYWWNCDNGYDHLYLMPVAAKITRNYGCPYCSGHRLLKGFNDLETKCPDLAKEWDYELNEKKPSDYMSGARAKVWWKCPNCGDSYQQPLHSRTNKNGLAGCPNCNSRSKYEKKIRSILEQHNINFEQEKSFSDLRDKKRLKYDFVIYDKNGFWIGTIEFNGKQHYLPNCFNRDNEKYEQVRYHDALKAEHCVKHHIPLLIIPYRDEKSGVRANDEIIEGKVIDFLETLGLKTTDDNLQMLCRQCNLDKSDN